MGEYTLGRPGKLPGLPSSGINISVDVEYHVGDEVGACHGVSLLLSDLALRDHEVGVGHHDVIDLGRAAAVVGKDFLVLCNAPQRALYELLL